MLRWRRSLRIPFHRGLFCAWGFASNGWTEEGFAHRAAAEGYAWAAIEHDDFDNAPRWPAFREACHANNLKALVWFTEGGNIRQTPDDAEGAIAEMEGPGDYEGIVDAIDHFLLPECPLAVVTNFNSPLCTSTGVPRPTAAAPLIEAGFHCLPECYLADNPVGGQPPNQDFFARQLGWESTQPVFGVYGPATLASYSQWTDWPGWSVYLAETMWE